SHRPAGRPWTESARSRSCKRDNPPVPPRCLPSPRLFFLKPAFAEPPGQLLVELGGGYLVIAERDQQMEQEVRRLVHNHLAILPLGREKKFHGLLGNHFLTFFIDILMHGIQLILRW